MSRMGLSVTVAGLLVVLAGGYALVSRGASHVDSTDPLSETSNRLHILHASIEQFRTERGRLPVDLEEVFGSKPVRDLQRASSLRYDAWGTAISYTVQDDTFHVSSAGPDSVFATDDDVWPGRE